MKSGHLLLLSSVLTVCVAGIQQKGHAMESLDQAQWRNRVILIKSEGEIGPYAEKLRDQKAGVDDRDVLWFVLGSHQLQSNLGEEVSDGLRDSIRLKFRENEPARILLLGKDGGVKLRSDKLDVQRIFDLIDTMPMRIHEMKNN